jgi:hypothetical protein
MSASMSSVLDTLYTTSSAQKTSTESPRRVGRIKRWHFSRCFADSGRVADLLWLSLLVCAHSQPACRSRRPFSQPAFSSEKARARSKRPSAFGNSKDKTTSAYETIRNDDDSYAVTSFIIPQTGSLILLETRVIIHTKNLFLCDVESTASDIAAFASE